MKRMIAVIGVLVIFLGVAFFDGNQDLKAKNQVPTVGILQLTTHPALDAIHRGIVASLKERGYEDGKTVHLDFQNAQADQSNLKSMSEQFKSEKADVMIGIATPAAQALANVTKKIPIVLGAITDPKGAGLVAHNERPGGNITGVSDQTPVKGQIELMQKIIPNLKTVGVIYTVSDASAASQVKLLKKEIVGMGIKLKIYTVTSTNDVNQVAQTMVKEVQGVYVPNDNTIASAMGTLVKVANVANTPIFPSVDTMVKEGGVATMSINQFKLGQLTGEMTADILDGKSKPATTPIQYLRKGELIINLKQAAKLKLTIPESLLKEATEKGEVIR